MSHPFECRIPSDNALKQDVIYCVAPTPPEVWMVSGTWVGALAALLGVLLTAVMAVFAWRAWQTSREQIESAQKISLVQRRSSALAEFLVALGALVDLASKNAGAEILRASSNRAQVKAEIWTMTFPVLLKSQILVKVVKRLELMIGQMSHLRSALQQEMKGNPDRHHGVIEAGENGVYVHLENASSLVELTGEITLASESIRRTSYELMNEEVSASEADEALRDILSKLHRKLPESWGFVVNVSV